MGDHNEPSLYYLLGTKLPQAVLGVKKQTTAEGYAPTLSLREPWIFGISTTSSGSQLSYEENGKHSLVTPDSIWMSLQQDSKPKVHSNKHKSSRGVVQVPP